MAIMSRKEWIGALLGALMAVPAIGVAFFDVDPTTLWNGRSLAARKGAEARTVIGFVEQKDRDVRLRPADMPVWDETNTGALLRQRDHVFTGSGAKASLALDDGTRIEVAERSLVVVEKQQAATRLEVKRGLIEAHAAATATGGAIELALAGQETLRVEKGRVQVEAMANGEASLTVLEGEALLRGRDGRAITIGSQERSVVRANGDVLAPRPLAVNLQLPASKARVYAGPEGLDFRWHVRASGGRLIVFEVARDRTFTSIVAREEGQGLEKARAQLAAGAYFWRVSLADPKDSAAWEQSDVRELFIIDSAPPLLLTPAPAAVVLAPAADPKSAATHQTPRAEVSFDWQRMTGERYELELARDRAFEHVLVRMERSEPPLRMTGLAPGSYVWRLRALRADQIFSQWSEARTFTVAEASLPSAPELGAPQDGASLEVKAAGELLALSWQPVTGVRRYCLEIGLDASFQKLAARLWPNEPRASFAGSKAATYYWRVRSVDDHGRQTEFSASRSFSLLAAPPSLLFPLESGRLALVREQPPVFSWQPAWLADSYTVELAEDARFEHPLVHEDLRATRFAWHEAKAGQFFWRVRARLGDGKVAVSSTRLVELLLAPQLRPPVLPDELLVPLDSGVAR